jgi:putative colanic acid biosynthesis UDP-glucose lipid carrier transferase
MADRRLGAATDRTAPFSNFENNWERAEGDMSVTAALGISAIQRTVASDCVRATIARAAKRSFDLLFSILLIVLTSPIMLCIAVAIRFDDGRPVIYTQTRRGFRGKDFKIYKFRTMKTSTKLVEQLAATHDPRFTRLAPFLRYSCLDECPQLFNVLIGNMSVVGPRPRPLWHEAEFAHNISFYTIRFRVKPGITGLAQINTKHGSATPEDMQKSAEYDRKYVESWSFWLDVLIVYQTGVIVIRLITAQVVNCLRPAYWNKA